MLPLLALVPTIFTILEKVAVPVLAEHRIPLISALVGTLANSPTANSIISSIEGVIGHLEDTQKLELQAELSTLLAQANIDNTEATSEKWFISCWRPFLAWGLSINIVAHATVITILDIIELFGYNPYVITPIDSITLTLMSGLLGIYMTARTVEKYTTSGNE